MIRAIDGIADRAVDADGDRRDIPRAAARAAEETPRDRSVGQPGDPDGAIRDDRPAHGIDRHHVGTAMGDQVIGEDELVDRSDQRHQRDLAGAGQRAARHLRPIGDEKAGVAGRQRRRGIGERDGCEPGGRRHVVAQDHRRCRGRQIGDVLVDGGVDPRGGEARRKDERCDGDDASHGRSPLDARVDTPASRPSISRRVSTLQATGTASARQRRLAMRRTRARRWRAARISRARRRGGASTARSSMGPATALA